MSLSNVFGLFVVLFAIDTLSFKCLFYIVSTVLLSKQLKSAQFWSSEILFLKEENVKEKEEDTKLAFKVFKVQQLGGKTKQRNRKPWKNMFDKCWNSECGAKGTYEKANVWGTWRLPHSKNSGVSGFLGHLQENTGASSVQGPGPHIIPAASEELWTDPEMCMRTTAQVILICIGVWEPLIRSVQSTEM